MKRLLIIFCYLALLVAVLAPSAYAKEDLHAGHDMHARSVMKSSVQSFTVEANLKKTTHLSLPVVLAPTPTDCMGGHCPACLESGSLSDMCSRCFMEEDVPQVGTVPSIPSFESHASELISSESMTMAYSSSDSGGALSISSKTYPRLLRVLRL